MASDRLDRGRNVVRIDFVFVLLFPIISATRGSEGCTVVPKQDPKVNVWVMVTSPTEG